MKMSTLREIAERNLQEHLRDNPCRGIVLGLGEAGQQMQVSWIMGRSPNSQNRVYTVQEELGLMKTEAADPSKVKDPSLIIYNVMRSYSPVHIASNGDQTDTAIEAARSCDMNISYFFKALNSRFCEPDAPNFTPRITGYQGTRWLDLVALSVLKAEPFHRAEWIEREAQIKSGASVTHRYDRNQFPTVHDQFIRTVSPGFGYMLTTYMPGSKELPSFQGEPLLVPMRGTLEDAMQTFWNALEPEWRVSVGGREIMPDAVRYAAPINRFTKVGGE
jgi:hypothetical protein